MERKTKGNQSDDPREMQRNLERYVGRRPDENLTIKAQVGTTSAVRSRYDCVHALSRVTD